MKDSKFMSADEKRKVLKQWQGFLAGGLKETQFTEALYEHLIQHCSFIAHYDRGGFFATYFESGETTSVFLSQFDQRKAASNGIPPSVEYGGTWWVSGDYEDVNKEMIAIAAKYIPALLEQAKRDQKALDVAEAKRLLGKHEIVVPGL